jgi:flagellar assembly protein FliH
MRSTSSDGVVVRHLPESTVEAPAHHVDLRSGAWTRLGSGTSLGDPVTEGILGGIAERSQQAARAQGYAQGWAEGRRTALARAEAETAEVRRAAAAERDRQHAEHRQAITALEAATAQMSSRLAEALDQLAGHTVDAALQLTEAVVGREVATATDPGADALRRAMALVDPQVTPTVRLNPADRALLDPAATEGRNVVVVDDPTVARGDAVAETDVNLVDATIEAALARVREVLLR